MNFFKKLNKKENNVAVNSKEAAKERLHLVFQFRTSSKYFIIFTRFSLEHGLHELILVPF